MPAARVVSWFSCGAASAAATHLALNTPLPFGATEVVVAYCDTSRREHPDNERFLKDCERWFGQPILRLTNEDYPAGDPDEVFRKTRYLVGPGGARCTAELKKKVRWAFQRPTDIVILGYTTEEYAVRGPRTEKAEPLQKFWPILNERKLTKQNCKDIVTGAGIELPEMYRLGYKNNNCIGCVKGQAGYWNKIRVDFPDRFAEMVALERELKRTICKQEWSKNGVRTRKRLYLDELPPDLGRYEAEPDISCGITCHSAEQ
jgi:hypothetical protein